MKVNNSQQPITPQERQVKKEAEQIRSNVNKLAQLSVKSNENKELSKDLIFKQLLGGDQQSRIETLAKLLILEKETAKPEEVAAAQKTLLEGGILEGMLKEKMTQVNTPENLLQSQFVVPQSIVKIEFDETTFTDLDQEIANLSNEIGTLKTAFLNQIKEVSGTTATLLASSSGNQKLEAEKLLHFYNDDYNNAITSLKKLKIQEDFVNELNTKITNMLQEFIKLNQQRITFLLDLFADLSHRHNLLADKLAYGFERTTTKWLGGSSVKVPTTNNLQARYMPLSQAIEFPKIHNIEYFSYLFTLSHRCYSDINKFADITFTHYSDVIATNTALTDSNPNFEQAKEKAKLLPENYKELHDKCLDHFALLENSTETLKELEKPLKERATQKMLEISTCRKNLIELTNTLEKAYKALDRAIHDGQEIETKEFQTLTEKSVSV